MNAFDETLTPQAAGYGEPRSPVVPGTENSYYALLALGAPDGADGIMYARAWMDEARAAAAGNASRTAGGEAREAPDPLPRRAGLVSCRGKSEAGWGKGAPGGLSGDLARYETLLGFKRYTDRPMAWDPAAGA